MKIGVKFGLKCMILPTGKSAKNPVGRVMGTTSENPGRLGSLQGVVFNKHRQWKMGVLRGYMANIKETFPEELTTFLHF